jgi:hypothetical protein
MAMETTAFRLDEVGRKLVARLAEVYEVSKGKVMRQALGLLAQLQIAAANDSYSTVAALVERYGEGAEIHIAVFETDDGLPSGGITIDGKAVDDVRAVPVVDLGSDSCYVFLDVAGTAHHDPVFVTTGDDEAMMVRHARLSAGRLPWPPDPDNRLALVMRLEEMPSTLSWELAQLSAGNGHAH